jgi:serine protease
MIAWMQMHHRAGLAAFLSVASAPLGAAADDAWYVDGAHRVFVEKSVGEAVGADVPRPGLRRVTLRYPDRGLDVPALVDDTLIVQVGPEAMGALAELGLEPVRPLMRSIDLWLVRDGSGGDGVDGAARVHRADGPKKGIRLAVHNLYLRVRPTAWPFTQNDPRFPGQWFFENLKMTEAWGLTQGDSKTSIVVVDTGCDLTHPDLVAKLDPGRDVVDADDDPSFEPGYPGAEHGTACAGLVGASTNNAEGIAGACPECRVRCVRMLTDQALPISVSIAAFDFAFEVGAAVVSNSWGYVDPTPVPTPLAAAMGHVFDQGRGGRGALVLFAMGNDDRVVADDELQAARGVLGIGAINNFDEQTPFTNSGNSVDLVAPTGTLTTDITGSEGGDPSDYLELFGGTSSACPVAAGIAGLLVSAAPEKTSQELYDVMIATARPAPLAIPDENGHDQLFGYGIVDPVAALHAVLDTGGPDAGATSSSAGPGAGGNGSGSSDDGGCSIGAGAHESVGWALYAFMTFAFACALLRARTRATRR